MLKEPLMMNSVGKRMSHTRSDATLLFRCSTKPGTETDKEGAKHKAPSIVLAVHHLGFGWECLCLNVQVISFEVPCQLKRYGRLIRSKSLFSTRVRVKVQNRSPGDRMKIESTSPSFGAGTPDVPSTPNVPSSSHIPSTPVVPAPPSVTDSSITEEEAIALLTPEGLSRREYNLFKRKRKAALKEALQDAQAAEAMDTTDDAADSNLPAGYKRGEFGRQARKLTKSHDKHGMLSPLTHGIIKPSKVWHYQYKRCFKVAQDFAKRKAQAEAKKRGGIRIVG